MRKLAALAASTAILVLAGCGGGGGGKVGTGDEGAPSIRGDVQTAPATSPAAQVTAKAGQAQTQDADGYKVVVTVYSYRQPLPSEDSPSRAGFVFAGVDVRMCIKASPNGGPVSISNDPWSLTYGDDTTIGAEYADSDSFSLPLYPQDSKSIAVGDCVRGWVVFQVPKAKRPVRTLYTTSGTEEPVPPLRWTIG